MEDIIGFSAQIKKAQRIVKNKNLQPIAVKKAIKPVAIRPAAMPLKPVASRPAAMPLRPVANKPFAPAASTFVKPIAPAKTVIKKEVKTLVPQIIPGAKMFKAQEIKPAVIPFRTTEEIKQASATQTPKQTTVFNQPLKREVINKNAVKESVQPIEAIEPKQETEQPKINKTLLIGGAALLAFLMFKKRK